MKLIFYRIRLFIKSLFRKDKSEEPDIFIYEEDE